jgi:two-component system LytT family response regulator
MIRALLVDDERIARQELRRLLEAHPQVEVVAEAGNAADARRLLREHDVDLLFLDVEMPGETGLELARGIEDQAAIIFCTAHHAFAAEAFTVSALDYLLKPVAPDRLARALARFRGTGAAGTPGDGMPGDGTPGSYMPYDYGLMLRFGDSGRVVRLREIDRFESIGNYVAIHCSHGMSMVLGTLTRVEERLDPQYFLRANRGEIIRLDAIRSLDADVGNGMVATLQGGQQVEISRRQAQAMRARMGMF